MALWKTEPYRPGRELGRGLGKDAFPGGNRMCKGQVRRWAEGNCLIWSPFAFGSSQARREVGRRCAGPPGEQGPMIPRSSDLQVALLAKKHI